MLHNKHNKNSNIILRVLFFNKNNSYYAICLDTDIIVKGRDVFECRTKLIDAISLYMNSFSKEEIEKRQYVRYAPLKYFIKPVIFILGVLIRQMWGSLIYGEYDIATKNVKLA